MKTKLMAWTLICSVLLLMLPVHAEAASEKVTLKVLDYSQEDFNKRFGDAFTAKYPNIEVKVIRTLNANGKSVLRGDELRKLEDKEKPDLLLPDKDSLEKYVAEGRLIDLEPYIAQSKSIKLANLNQNMVNSMKVKGKLYTLSPTFMTKGLFYIKTLFDKYKIKYPKNKMSWAEVMDLAAEIKNKAGSDKVEGFDYDYHLFSLADTIARSYKSDIPGCQQGRQEHNHQHQEVETDLRDGAQGCQKKCNHDGKRGLSSRQRGNDGI
ncbi:hypothetical protein J6TS7_19670 [Paenibacillus dendritiformis]|uniref:ABC transporter substrate-binding protein n=1 Tax=Paenibacillus TaxID=44249 RepID=UPI001B0A8FD7|nr:MULTISPECIES: ABC transporter substrate-binding protein [Paenibacillus]MEB9895297.1 ABC transporter substrate-binding protein [Bacillus cereus]GIO78357.1 hypothetical protein J6TS7_19670 [Paenibacillus dendritiformis]